MSKVQNIQGIINIAIPFLCFIFETSAFVVVLYQHDSICVQARENDLQVQAFLTLICVLILPDLVECLLAAIDYKSIVRPFGPTFQLVSMIVCFGASFILYTGITNCGNAAQDMFSLAMVLILIAGLTHFIYIILVLMQMPRTVKFAIPSPFNKTN